MDVADRERGLRHLLAATAQAHHEATGGPNTKWAQWYAERLEGHIDEFVGFSPSVDEITGWLLDADRRQRAEDPDGRWTAFYARMFVEDYARG
jgi:hypothetical protein